MNEASSALTAPCLGRLTAFSSSLSREGKTTTVLHFLFSLGQTLFAQTVWRPGLCGVTMGADITLMTTPSVCFSIPTTEGLINTEMDDDH